MSKQIDDRRGDKTEPWGFVVFTDSFLSGWGRADRARSLYALAVSGPREADVVLANGKARTDMKRGRIVGTLAGLRRSVQEGDHLAIVDRENAKRWYASGGW